MQYCPERVRRMELRQGPADTRHTAAVAVDRIAAVERHRGAAAADMVAVADRKAARHTPAAVAGKAAAEVAPDRPGAAHHMLEARPEALHKRAAVRAPVLSDRLEAVVAARRPVEARLVRLHKRAARRMAAVVPELPGREPAEGRRVPSGKRRGLGRLVLLIL